VVAIVSKPQYRAFAEEFVLTEELGQEVPDDPLGPAKDGAVTFLSFLVFGSIPLWVYVITWGAKYTNSNGSFGISAAACALSLFALGWLQGTITRQPRFKAAMFMTINGSLASAAAYLVGWGIMQAIGNGGEEC
jgi:vacuolar iron transporter family protein